MGLIDIFEHSKTEFFSQTDGTLAVSLPQNATQKKLVNIKS